MTDTLSAHARALRLCGERLGELGARLATLDPGSEAFGAAAPGALGELGRRLHLLCQGALAARSREVAIHQGQIDAIGDAVRTSSDRYADADDAARRGQ